jgi:hypothetical protein
MRSLRCNSGFVMVEGIYLITFRGLSGWGQGLLFLRLGKVTGADAQGCLYDGSYTVQSNAIFFDLTLTVPPGVALVTATYPQPIVYTLPFQAVVTLQAMEEQTPFLVTLGPTQVNVIVKRLRSLEA